MTEMRQPTERSLKITKISSTVSLGECDRCNAKFRCYLPQPEKAEWELNTWFQGHTCRNLRKPQAAA
jgi:hypothetical protein